MQMLNENSFVWQTWYANARENPNKDAIVHWEYGEEPYRWQYAHLLTTSEDYAQRLWEGGIRPGNVCAIVVRHNRKFYPVYLAVCLLGAIPTVIPYPNDRLHPTKFQDSLEGMSRKSGLDWLLVERDLENLVTPLMMGNGSTINGVLYPCEWEIAQKTKLFCEQIPHDFHQGLSGDSTFLLQHSSGTTGLQKGVALSHKSVLDHLHRYGKSLTLQPHDKIASWLPLYHDMGLIAAFHLPLYWGITVVQMSPFEWVMAPIIWLEVVSSEKATLSWLPNFSYNHMVRSVHTEDLENVSLGSLRLVINCSEPVRSESHDRFYAHFSAFGLRREVLGASYAMAEATFAVTQTRPGEEAKRLYVDRDLISNGLVQINTPSTGSEGTNRVCVSSGVPISGCELRIVDEHGQDLPDRAVGEVILRSSALFSGYRNNPEKTAEVLKDGWYSTGDIAFCHEGEFYIIGRKKDLIIVAGKNVYPEDIEDAVSKIPGILPGRVVAFGEEVPSLGTEQICVIAESSIHEESELKRLKKEILEVGNSLSLTLSKVSIVEPRWLIKSSSGKPSRKANKERYIQA